MGKDMHRPGQLDQIAAAFDVVLIDCPGREGAVVRAALMVADLVLIPCGASPAGCVAQAQNPLADLIAQNRALEEALRAQQIARPVHEKARAEMLGA